MRIALLNPWYWPEVRRGSERLLHDLAADLTGLGHEPVLITSHDAPSAETLEDGFAVVRLRRGRLHALRRRRALRGADAVVAAYPTVVPRRFDGPVVFAAMGMATAGGTPAQHEAVRRADVVTALSAAAAASIERHLHVTPEVIHPGVDLARFTPGGFLAPEPLVGCVADANEPRKRVGELEAACREVGVELRVAGPQDDVLALYREAWVTGLASVEEAFGLALVESLACGTPVFARADGGGREIITPETGVLFDDDLPDAIRAALELPRGAACRARAERFPSRATAEAYAALLTRVRSG